MKTRILASLALLACVAASGSNPTVKQAKVTGDYVEARTASVYAGACHYNGEVVTVGKDAIMAWSFNGGSHNGVDLTGVVAMAAVTSDANLIDQGNRKSELAIDPSASDKQVAAVKSMLQEKLGAQLGTIVAVRRIPVAFKHTSEGYTVNANGFGLMSVQYMADDACCKMPGLVWYSPLTTLENRKVGFTEVANYSGSITDRWERAQENSAFYGAFSF